MSVLAVAAVAVAVWVLMKGISALVEHLRRH